MDSIRADLEQINRDLSFGVSRSQSKRNNHVLNLCNKVLSSIHKYAKELISTANSRPNEILSEQNAHNIVQLILWDVQLEDAYHTLLEESPKNCKDQSTD